MFITIQICLTLIPGSALALAHLEIWIPAEPAAFPGHCWPGPSWRGPCSPGTLLAPCPSGAAGSCCALAASWACPQPWGGTREPSLGWALPLWTPQALVSHLSHEGLLLVGPSPSHWLWALMVVVCAPRDSGTVLGSPVPSLLCSAPSLSCCSWLHSPQRAQGYPAAMALLHSKALPLTPGRRNGDEYAKEGRMLSGFWASAKFNDSEQPKPKLGFCALLPGRSQSHCSPAQPLCLATVWLDLLWHWPRIWTPGWGWLW